MSHKGVRMLCWSCRNRRWWPDEFPWTSYAKCWWCYPYTERVTAPEWQVPKALRWWRTAQL